MAEVSVRDNGPLLVKGDFVVMDGAGNAYEKKDMMALCRCGSSANKPFCDGTHKTAFQSEPRA